MMPSSQPPKSEASGPIPLSHPLISLIKACATTALLLMIILAIMNYTGLLQLASFIDPGDHISKTEMEQRITAFNALQPLPLSPVKPDEISKALDSMQLSAAARKDLESNLAESSSAASVPTAFKTPPSAASPEQASAAAQAQQRVRLVWVTLWDTDVEDGDVVRIDSRGYSRTVVLRKQPQTFAIPLPGNGIINVTGVDDGDGGGITVGLASGESKAVFPIMSIGQVLGLKVRVN